MCIGKTPDKTVDQAADDFDAALDRRLDRLRQDSQSTDDDED